VELERFVISLFALRGGALNRGPADPVITPEMFAQTIVEDYGLAASYHATITKLIQDQLSDFKAHTSGSNGAEADDEREAPRKGALGEDDLKWWKNWRKGAADRAKAAKGQAPRKRRKIEPEEEPLELDGFEFDEGTAEDDMRVVIKVCNFISGEVRTC
jgi:SWI/SNF-related matrix-associated actin-dependent regulator of chromatin subfamily B member 1